MPDTIDVSRELLRRAADGDQTALADLLAPYRGRLKRLVRIRLNPRLQGRVDDSDVIQDALLEASQRLGEYRFYMVGVGQKKAMWPWKL
jgi:RNA polymerase sigma-70 factor (ECF subfamily)